MPLPKDKLIEKVKSGQIKTDTDLAIYTAVAEAEETMSKQVEEVKTDTSAKIDKIESKFDDTITEIKASIPNLDTVLKAVKGKAGDNGTDGKDAVVNYPFLIKEVVSRVPKPKDGETPVIDYRKIVDEAVSLIPKPADGVSPEIDYDFIIQSVETLIKLPEYTGEQVVEKINTQPKDAPKIKKERVEGLAEIERLATFGATRPVGGGGSSGVRDIRGGTNTTVTQLNGVYTVNSTSSSTVSAFTDLTDVPSSYSGQGLKGVRVNTGATGLEFYTVVDTDEKVKYDGSDASAGYLGAKTVAGTGITLSEGTGGDADKLKISTSFNIADYLTSANAASTYVTSVTGTTNRITSSGGLTPSIDISASYVGQASITTLGTITTGVWQGTSIGTTYTDAKIKTVTGTSNRLTIGGTATDPTFDISTSYVGQASITTLGTITTGVWNGTAIGDTYISSAATWNAKQPAGNYITALTGDVTASGPGSVAGTIANNVVTYAKFQQVAASSLVGNATGSLANATGITLGGTLVFSGSALTSTATGSAKLACRVTTTAALTVTYANGSSGVGATLTNAGAQAAISIDGVSLSAGDRVLVKDQASSFQNGIYSVTTVGTGATNWVLTRTTDFDGSVTGPIIYGSYANIVAGTVGAGIIELYTGISSPTIGTTAITWIGNAATAGGSITGSGAANQLTYWNGTATITGNNKAKLTLAAASNTIMELHNDGGASDYGWFQSYGHANGYGGLYYGYSSGGTQASPTLASANAYLNIMSGNAHNGTSYFGTASIQMRLRGGAPSSTSLPTSILVYTTPVGSTTQALAMTIDHGARTGFGNISDPVTTSRVEIASGYTYHLHLSAGSAGGTFVQGADQLTVNIIGATTPLVNIVESTAITSSAAARVGLRLQGFASQSADLLNYENSSGAIGGKIDSNFVQYTRAGLNTVGTKFATIGGTLFDYITDVSVGGTEADIYTDTIPVSILGTNKDKLIASYSGNFVTVGTELCQLKAYFGGTAIWDSTGVAPTTGTTSWNIYVEIIRVSSTVVRYSVGLTTTGASGYVYQTTGELTGLTLSNTNVLKVTGTSSGVGSGTGDIVGKMGYVKWLPAGV